MRILYVEDHRDTATAFKILLERMGNQVDVAETAGKARSLCIDREYDLWLIDLGLPDDHGGNLLKALRRMSDTKAIAFTGLVAPEDNPAGLDDFDAFLAKPASIEQFLETAKGLGCVGIPQSASLQ